MINSIDEIKTMLLKNKGLIIVVLLVLSLLIPSILRPQLVAAAKRSGILEVALKTNQQNSAPPITVISTPTIIIPTSTPLPTVTIVPSPAPTTALTPTPTAVLTVTPTVTLTPTPTQQAVTTSTPIPTLTPTPSPIDTPTPTPAGLKIQIVIDYAGQKTADSYIISVNQGQTAWDAVVAAVGINNLQYTDYGGGMGKFINGFNGVNAGSNQYFEFRVNGVSSNVGVSSYSCNDGDKLDFVLTSS